MSIPAQCHLWQADTVTMKDLLEALTVVETFLDEPHQTRDLRQCKLCGQLYFHEFVDWIYWEKGDDPQCQTFIPVDSRDEIARSFTQMNSAFSPSRPACSPTTPKLLSLIESTGCAETSAAIPPRVQSSLRRS